MAKTHWVLFSVVALFFAPTLVSASDVTVLINQINDELVYHQDYDILAMDFELNTSQERMLKTIALKFDGTARFGAIGEYTKVNLFVDRGADGFQGTGFDQLLASANQSGDSFLFTNIDHKMNGEERFFVTIESAISPDNKPLQLKLQDIDLDNDGVYDSGDKGIFFADGADVVYTSFPIPKTIHFKSQKVDENAPKGTFVGLDYEQGGYFYGAEAHMLVLKGTAKDRNGGTVTKAELLIGGQRIPVENTGIGFGSWRALFMPDEDVTETSVRLYLEDSGLRSWTSPEVNLFLDKRLVSASRSSFAVFDDQIDLGESTTLIATLRDHSGEVLPNRSVTIRKTAGDGVVENAPMMTNENGQVQLPFTGSVEGETKFEVIYEDDVLLSQVVKVIKPEDPSSLKPGTLIKGVGSAVYYYSGQGKRHVFVNDKVYKSWYGDDFSEVVTLSAEELAAIPLGASVTFRPGTMLTTPSINEVYLVTEGAKLRHITSEAIAQQLFGSTWNKQIHDFSDSLLFSYEIGTPIESASGIVIPQQSDTSITIESELNALL